MNYKTSGDTLVNGFLFCVFNTCMHVAGLSKCDNRNTIFSFFFHILPLNKNYLNGAAEPNK